MSVKKPLVILVVAFAFLVSGCAPKETAEESPEISALAKCLTEKGVFMYGSFTCSICEREKELFGPSFKHITEIECHPRGKNPETDRCLKMDIAKTPTWILEKDGQALDRLEGYQPFEALAEFSGCTYNG